MKAIQRNNSNKNKNRLKIWKEWRSDPKHPKHIINVEILSDIDLNVYLKSKWIEMFFLFVFRRFGLISISDDWEKNAMKIMESLSKLG